MKKKIRKGFTLVELLGTIVVLGIIVTIVIVAVTSVINNSKKKTYVLSETNIVSTALTYAKENNNSFYSDEDNNIEYQCITVQELIDLGYFKKDIIDSKIENNNSILNINPEMIIYVDRNLETKVYGEGQIIKNQNDELNQSCAYLDILTCPTIDSYNGTYDGNSHKITLDYLNNGLEVNYKTSSTDPWNNTEPSRTDVGNTKVFVQIVNQVGQHKYCSNGNINISKKDLTVAWSGGTNFTYTGEDLGPTAEADTGTGETIELTSTKFKEVGSHTSTASCVKVDNDETKCNNFNLTNMTKEFTIEVEVVQIALPTNSYCINRTYNGSEQTLTTDPGEGFVFQNNKKTNAGSYTITATLEENYMWQDGTTTPKTFNCSINKKDISVSWSGDIFTYNDTLQGPTASADTGTGETIELTSTKYKDIGTHTSTASCVKVDNDETKCNNFELTNKTKNFIIEDPTILVNIPTNTYCVSRTYTGSEQVLTKAAGEGFTFSNNKKTDAGTYTITATLNSGYAWNDGTSTTKTFKCTIERKAVAQPACSSKKYNGSEQTLFAAHAENKQNTNGYWNDILKGKTAGTYSTKLHLSPNYQWSKGEVTTSDRNIYCTITPATAVTKYSYRDCLNAHKVFGSWKNSGSKCLNSESELSSCDGSNWANHRDHVTYGTSASEGNISSQCDSGYVCFYYTRTVACDSETSNSSWSSWSSWSKTKPTKTSIRQVKSQVFYE